MDSEGSSSGLPGSDNQDSNEPAPPGTVTMGSKAQSTPLSSTPRLLPSSKGVENAKKRLRAFSIQKKTPITPSQLTKPTATGSMAQTVLIGKLSSVKVTPKVEDEQKKQPKPPKPGSSKRNFQDSYTDLQKRTLAEIEDMKRKMELVDLGIPLGLICPSSNNDKAMPTKAMPPIKSFLDASKVDEIIRDAKAARAEGREFKFDYQKLLPDYDNPFQRKKDDPAAQEKEKEEFPEKEEKYDRHYTPKSDRDRDRERDRSRDSSKRKSDRYSEFKRHSDYRKEDRDRYRDKRSEKNRDRDKESKESKSKESSEKSADKTVEQEVKETDVNLNDYLVCDSWSLDNDDKTSSPQVEDKPTKTATPVRKESKPKEAGLSKEPLKKKDDKITLLKAIDSPQTTKKVEKLQPVMDSFKFEIDPNDDEILDIFDEDSKLEKFAKPKMKKTFDYNQDTNNSDSLADDSFLESVINEIKQENLSGDDSQDKGLVEYDSPMTDYSKGQGTPELDDSMRVNTSHSDYSDGYRSTDSKYSTISYKSAESGYKSTGSSKSEDSRKELSVEKELDNAMERKMSRATAESLDIWNFVLKICQPLLFRHDKKSCYKQTVTAPALWWCARASGCGCVRGRGVVLAELRAQRMPLVDRVYGCDQIFDEPFPKRRGWYPPAGQCLQEGVTLLPQGAEDPQLLHQEYQRFMEAVWPEGTDGVHSQSNTPVRPAREEDEDKEEDREDERKKKKLKLSSEGWSQESDVEQELDKRSKKQRVDKNKDKTRKRKRSSSTMSTTTDDEVQRKRKKKANKKSKSKLAKRARTEKKYLKKLKEKQKKKKKHTKTEKMVEDDEIEEPKKKQKDKKAKKKQAKLKKKHNQKKKKSKAKSSSSSSYSSSSSSEPEDRPKKSKKKKKKDDAFDVNILNNIKTEKLTDDEKCHKMRDEEFSPRWQPTKRQEIINVKELQSDLGVQIKKEIEDVEIESEAPKIDDFDLSNNDEFMEERDTEMHAEKMEFKEPQDSNRLTPQPRPPADETNLSQCSSQESICSETDRTHQPTYEKDESHLRPSSQNSNYSFNDVIASQSGYSKMEASDCEKFEYEQPNYEMYEQLAMAYQSDVASNQVPLPAAAGTQRIETVALRRRGEIKCDWRAGDAPATPAGLAPARSRWGLKPSEVNIVLTGGSSEHFAPAEEPVYQIESIANRNDNSTGYDEAYMDMYGAMDRLQYGDCFAAREPPQRHRRATLDDRIDQALRHTVLGDIAMEPENQETEADKENTDKGILVTRAGGARAGKRVSFADGYKPGQDSDTEEPPIKKRRKGRRVGCAWPCPASHADHVPLWDALPPPPPPASPPPPPRAAPPLRLLRRAPAPRLRDQAPHKHQHKFDPSVPLAGFMPPEPPPGLITFPPASGFP